MTTQKIAPGYYTFQYKSIKVYLVKVEGHINWYYQIGESGGADDWYSSKREAIKAAIEWIDGFMKNT